MFTVYQKKYVFLRFCYMLILGIICLHSRSAAFCHEAAFAHLACFLFEEMFDIFGMCLHESLLSHILN